MPESLGFPLPNFGLKNHCHWSATANPLRRITDICCTGMRSVALNRAGSFSALRAESRRLAPPPGIDAFIVHRLRARKPIRPGQRCRFYRRRKKRVFRGSFLPNSVISYSSLEPFDFRALPGELKRRRKRTCRPVTILPHRIFSP